MLPVHRILYATDFSEPSFHALAVADELAQHFEAELLLLNVVTPTMEAPTTPGAALAPNLPAPSDVVDAAKQTMAIVLKERVPDSVRARTMVLEGLAADEIARAAEDEKADVIVIGTHGLTGWRHLVFGSVAEHVVRKARCPVITVPDAKKML